MGPHLITTNQFTNGTLNQKMGSYRAQIEQNHLQNGSLNQTQDLNSKTMFVPNIFCRKFPRKTIYKRDLERKTGP